MDDTTRRFAYRCLPLTIANQHGWELLCPCSFEALWTGGRSTRAIQIVRLAGDGPLPESHFGEGVLTFHPGYLFRTEDRTNLFVTGPLNTPKDGIAPLSGVVETSWLPFTFTMNWKFTRVGIPVRFETGDPFCHFFPLDPGLVEQVEPEFRDLSSDATLQEQYSEWSASRDQFNRELFDPTSEATAQQWQRYYLHGAFHTGEPLPSQHRTRLEVKPFRGAEEPSESYVLPMDCDGRRMRGGTGQDV